jgi:thioesterase domain-containing protein
LRIGWNASFSFDMSMKGFLQLLSGHCLVIIAQEVRSAPASMIAFLRAQRIDGFDVTPSLLRVLVAEGLLDEPRERTVLVGGEPIDLLLWQQLQQSRHIVFHNMYGPTECTVDATMGPIRPDEPVPHIGRPLNNARIYLLDEARQPVPLGSVGEIYIGGECVARGYFNRPDLTAERFLPDPFHAVPGARMYRTGDLARYLDDGKLVYHGRNDDQIKIRGFRVELGEIDARINELDIVRDAVTVARDDGQDLRLVAYLVAADPSADSADLIAQVRTRLAASLPAYMVPAAYVRLDALPLTPNGKLDRRALPAPDDEHYARRGFDAPRGEVEETLAALWCELLGTERVGRHDDFFELGGHSLLALHLILKSRQAFACELALQDLFAGPTLAEFASVIARGRAGAGMRNLIGVRTGGTQAPLFVVHAGGGGMDYVRKLAPELPPDLPLYGLEATGLQGDEAPLRTVAEMAGHYVGCIRKLRPHGPYRLAGWSAGGMIAHEMARQLLAAGEPVEFVALIDTFRDLASHGFVVDEQFDDKARLLEMLEGQLDAAALAQVRALAGQHEFGALVEEIHARGLAPAGSPRADAGAVRAMLHTRHAINLAVQNHEPAPLAVPVWMFAADGNEWSAADAWREAPGTRLRVVRLQGDHMSLIDDPAHRQALGAALTAALLCEPERGTAVPIDA